MRVAAARCGYRQGMDLTSPLTRTAAGIARRALVPPLTVLDQRVVVPVLGESSPVHRVLAAVAGATAATTSAASPSPAPSAAAPQGPPSDDSHDSAGADRAEQTSEETPTEGSPESAPPPAEPGELTEDEQERIERLTEQLLAEQGEENFVGELADDELRRAQARIRAKQIVEQEDDRLGGDDSSNAGS